MSKNKWQIPPEGGHMDAAGWNTASMSPNVASFT